MEAIAKFAADRMLARLARWLRLLGADTIFDATIDGATMLKIARAEDRVFLTRDKRLRTASDAVFIESNNFRDQLRQVLAYRPFDFAAYAFTRCSRCNAVLREVSRDIVMRRVPPFVFASNEKFSQCLECSRIYWPATHLSRMISEVHEIVSA
jgi:uncharacterized protein with PIN domain